MKTKNLLVSLVALFVLAFAITSVSAANFADIKDVKVNNADASSVDVGVFAGQTIPVQVTFVGNENASDVRLKVWVSGASEYSATSERFDIVPGSTYTRLVAVQVPSKIDPTEGLTLNIDLESKNAGTVGPQVIQLAAQRSSYDLQILDVNIGSTIQSGSTVPVDVVLKNIGSHLAEDTFVTVSIPALGISQRAYFGDMSAVDQGGDVVTKQDAAEGRMYLKIPSSAKPGVYTVQVEAYNGDSSSVTTQKVAIVGASADSEVVSAIQSKTFAVGEKATYTLTLVNAGNNIKVYELVAQNSNDALNVNVDEPIVAVPAGSSKTVTVEAQASKADKYTFTVDVHSNGDLVSTQSFAANVQGSSAGNVFSGNTAIVLTVVLAIIFVVLLIVLIVLLTRKPEKTQEMGESYY